MPRPIHAAYSIPYGAQFGAIRAGGARRHQGCDYHCPVGTPIYGTGDGGVVVARGYQPDPNSGAGNYVTISYPTHRTTDMHMREASPLPNGARVDAQTIIGYVGLTGNAVNADPPGSHDHHQLTVGGILTDPEKFYGAALAGETGEKIDPSAEEEDMIQPLATRTIRNIKTGDVATLYPTGIALIGDPLTPDLSTASGIAFTAGQPRNDGSLSSASAGFYWFDLPDDHFQWELSRHLALLSRQDAHLKSLIVAQVTPMLTDDQLKKIGAAVAPPDVSALVAAISTLDAQADSYQGELRNLLAAGLSGTITLAPAK